MVLVYSFVMTIGIEYIFIYLLGIFLHFFVPAQEFPIFLLQRLIFVYL